MLLTARGRPCALRSMQSSPVQEVQGRPPCFYPTKTGETMVEAREGVRVILVQGSRAQVST